MRTNIFLLKGIINLIVAHITILEINYTLPVPDRSLLIRCKMIRMISVNIGIRSISDANSQTFFEIKPSVWNPRILLPTNATSKTVTGITSDKIAAVKYLISVCWGLKANCIPNIVKAMATKKDTIDKTTCLGADSASVVNDFFKSLITTSVSLLVSLLFSGSTLFTRNRFSCSDACVF